jgi:hypothetical protein
VRPVLAASTRLPEQNTSEKVKGQESEKNEKSEE